MKKSVFYTFFLILIKLTAQTTNHGIDSNWSQNPSSAVSIIGNVSETNNLQGSVANNMLVKQDGTVIIFYKQVAQNKWIQSSDQGNTWVSPGVLPGPAVNGLSTISADIDQNDNIYIVWKSGAYSLGFSKFNGSTWSPVYTINTQTQNAGDIISFSQISVDRNNRIHIMWQQGNHQDYTSQFYSTCWYARSTDGGNSFVVTKLSENTTNNYHAAFPVADFGGTSNDTLMIAWRENVNGGSNNFLWNWDVKARITNDGGQTWNPVITLEGSSDLQDHDQWDPNIIVDKNGIIHAFYHIYHNNVMPDYDANIQYEYSIDGGNNWSDPIQLSTSNVRSHLIKTAYDYDNNYVWCIWKDEMDFGNIPNNAQADLKAIRIHNNGSPIIGSQEFISDHLDKEVAYHNFKVGNDGIIRATYNTVDGLEGKGGVIYYTQRNTIDTSLSVSNEIFEGLYLYPNPTDNYVNISSREAMPSDILIRIYNPQGILVDEYKKWKDTLQLNDSGVYFVEITLNEKTKVFKLVKL